MNLRKSHRTGFGLIEAIGLIVIDRFGWSGYLLDAQEIECAELIARVEFNDGKPADKY